MEDSTLYIVPTPIGNLGDITIRALDVLKQVDIIVCEDTRHTIKLLNHYGIKKPLVSYEKHSEAKRLGHIIQELESGKNIALVSDAGTPLVSDPGSRIITFARDRGIRIEALPGPSAIITALSASGFAGPFRFIGFFPRLKRDRELELLRMNVSTDTIVFFESPHRIVRTLKYMDQALKDRQLCLAREISKVHEEYIVGSARELNDRLQQLNSIGEVTVMVKGSDRSDDIDESLLKTRAQELLESGYSKKDILAVLSKETGLRRNTLYDLLINLA
ncbi:MAG TPA: 16S rRNA (cytidine(1402)-2'-O)-methyltransferase [Deltaproteobacteria bacterium]|nr:16S rRNA (cytidine(1402)-2'-O)-methyltransferase [Deltaproteobacteria bacterium]HPJ94373.1 16S rRNA (cytidine(1402)-2'-O)-methyltransferase [Deltaproteobacteria bacterium]